MTGLSARAKKIIVLFVVLFSSMVVAPPANAFRWSVRMPDDCPYSQCAVWMDAKGPDDGYALLSKGGAAQWDSPGNAPLSHVSGSCMGVSLQMRTCDGTDIDGSSVSGDPSCERDIKVTICPKRNAAWWESYSYGFCEQ